MSSALFRAEGIKRSYHRRRILDVDLIELERGQIVAVLGPNGAGKSTLFRILMLLEPADAGAIFVDGLQVDRRDRDARRRIAGVFQRPHLFAGDVKFNVELGLAARGVTGVDRRERSAAVLDLLMLRNLVGVDARNLSGGEAQRVALARALVTDPEILMLDEPTATLDVTARARFREELARLLHSRAQATLLITHDPGDAFALADYVIVLQDGKVVQRGTPDELLLDPQTPFVAAFTGAELMIEGVVQTSEHSLVHVELEGGAHVMATANRELQPGTRVSIAYRPEDVVLALTDSSETSARNRFFVKVEAVRPAGALLRVRLEGDASLMSLITRESASVLDVQPGARLSAQIKATALRAFPLT